MGTRPNNLLKINMKQLSFTIVIPTRERADTLCWALKTCVMQNYDNLEIIVSDNFSQDNTREVVESFGDKRIRYVNTGKRVSMSSNWEFGLGHATGDYVSILGDDDGFLPESISKINELLCEHPDIPAISWTVSEYRWPNYIFEDQANKFLVNTRKGYSIKNAHENLKKTIFSNQVHRMLPWLYAGFVKLEVVSRIRKRSGGTFFHSQQPDIYSAVIISSTIDKYIYSHAPYSVAGMSKSSNGISYFNSNQDASAANKFLQEENIPFHKSLIIFPSMYLLVLESVMQARDVGLLSKELMPDLKAALKNTIYGINPINKKLCFDTLHKIVEINGIDPRFLSDIRVPSLSEKFNIFRKIYAVGKESWFVEFDGDNFSIGNIYDAAIAHDRLIEIRHPRIFRLAATLWLKSCSYLFRFTSGLQRRVS